MIIKINENLVIRQLDDELIILNADNSCYYGITNSGIEILKFINERKTCEFQEIVEFLIANYEISKDAAINDINELLNELKSENLIEIN
ncbi:MAG TPA: PqqD family protein [bacterium]|nr:PqqD family protein [bacterium]